MSDRLTTPWARRTRVVTRTVHRSLPPVLLRVPAFHSLIIMAMPPASGHIQMLTAFGVRVTVVFAPNSVSISVSFLCRGWWTVLIHKRLRAVRRSLLDTPQLSSRQRATQIIHWQQHSPHHKQATMTEAVGVLADSSATVTSPLMPVRSTGVIA